MTALIIILVIWASLSTILLILFVLANFGVCTNRKFLKIFLPKLFDNSLSSEESKSSLTIADQSNESNIHEITKDIEFIKTPFEIYSKRHVLNIEIPSNSQEPSIIDPIEYYTLSRIGESQFNDITHEGEIKIFPIIDGKHKYVPCYVSKRKHEPNLYCVGNEINYN